MDPRRIPLLSCVLCALLGAAWLAGEAGAKDYWQYTDVSGNVHFVDALERVPTHLRGRATRVGSGDAGPRVNRMESRPPPARRAPDEPAAAPAAARVVVYTAPWCGWCRRTLAWLDERGVAYENRDIEADPDHRRQLVQKTGGTAIPVVEIGGELVRGFDPARWEELL